MSSSAVVETIETQAHRIIDKKDGILRVYSKPSHIDLEDVEALFAKFAEIRKGERLLVLLDPTEENSMTAEARKLLVKHLKDDVRCLAVIGRKKFVRSLFDIISSFVDIGVDMKMFDKETKAEKWLFESYL